MWMWMWIALVGCRGTETIPPPPPVLPELEEGLCVEPGTEATSTDVAVPLLGVRGYLTAGDIDGDGADEVAWVEDAHVHTSDGARFPADASDLAIGDLDGDGVDEIVAAMVLHGGDWEFECDTPPEDFEAAAVFDGEGTQLTSWWYEVQNIGCLMDLDLGVQLGPDGRILVTHRYDGAWVLQGDGGDMDDLAIFRSDNSIGNTPVRVVGGSATLGDVHGDGTVEVAIYDGDDPHFGVYPEEWGDVTQEDTADLEYRPEWLAAGVDLDGSPGAELQMNHYVRDSDRYETWVIDPDGRHLGTLPGDQILRDLTGDGLPEIGEIRWNPDAPDGGWTVVVWESPFVGDASEQEPWLSVEVPSPGENTWLFQLTSADLSGDGLPELLIGLGRGYGPPTDFRVIPVCP